MVLLDAALDLVYSSSNTTLAKSTCRLPRGLRASVELLFSTAAMSRVCHPSDTSVFHFLKAFRNLRRSLWFRLGGALLLPCTSEGPEHPDNPAQLVPPPSKHTPSSTPVSSVVKASFGHGSTARRVVVLHQTCVVKRGYPCARRWFFRSSGLSCSGVASLASLPLLQPRTRASPSTP